MNEKNNFEKACFDACESFVDSIEIIEEPIYSTKHIKKMNSITNGIRVGRVYFNRKTAMILVACILILTMNIVAFAYIGSQSKNKSKDLVFYSQNPIKIGDFTSGSGINVRVSGASDYKSKMAIKDLEYGYIPESYNEVFLYNEEQKKHLWANVYGEYTYYRREFEKNENGKVTGRIMIEKVIESNGMNLKDSVIYVDDETAEEIKDAVLNNDGIKVVSPDLQKFMETVTDFEENGIHYYFISSESESGVGGELLWNYDGYLYMLTSNNLPLEELVKIAKDAK